MYDVIIIGAGPAGISAGIYTVGYKGSIIEQDTSKADVSIDHYDQLKW